MEVNNILKSKNEQLQQELFRLLAFYAGQRLLLKSKKGIPSLGRLISGGALLYIGATGKLPLWSFLRRANTNHGQINCKQQILIQRSPEEVFAFFRDFRNLKRLLTPLETAKALDIAKKHWELRLDICGRSYKTALFVVKEKENEFLGWSAGEGACIYHTGRIELQEGIIPHITVMDFVFSYTPPLGKFGDVLLRPWKHAVECRVYKFLTDLRTVIEEENSLPEL